MELGLQEDNLDEASRRLGSSSDSRRDLLSRNVDGHQFSLVCSKLVEPLPIEGNAKSRLLARDEVPIDKLQRLPQNRVQRWNVFHKKTVRNCCHERQVKLHNEMGAYLHVVTVCKVSYLEPLGNSTTPACVRLKYRGASSGDVITELIAAEQ